MSDTKECIMLNAEDVADLLQLSPAGVRRLARQGRMPCVKIGRKVRFRASSIMQWIDIMEKNITKEYDLCRSTEGRIARIIGFASKSQASEQCRKALDLPTE